MSDVARGRLVIIGLGYVGLPLACEAARAGWSVSGLDVSPRVVSSLNEGRSHVDDVSDEDVAKLLETGFVAFGDESILSHADVVVICVPTPLSTEGGPDLEAVTHAAAAVSRSLREGQLVVLESTTYPGTTEEVLVPILESSQLRVGRDFNCAFSPERVDPGNKSHGIRNTPKVVGGVSAACSQRAADFYASIVDEVVVAKGPREAEMTKLLENTYRHVNIALVNEMAKFCHEMDIDLWDAIRCAATKPFGFSAFYPGPGVGGHCIPIDPNYLSHRVKAHLGLPFRFVELAQEINMSMPSYVVRRAQDLLNDGGLSLRGARVLILGVTYKKDIADQRESPANAVARGLLKMGAEVTFHDPLVHAWQIDGTDIPRVSEVNSGVASADLVLLLQGHTEYLELGALSAARRVLDTRGILHGPQVVRL